MKKQIILNVLLNLGIVFLIMSGIAAYKSGNMLILGLAIAIGVVLIYLKMVLLKYVRNQVKPELRKPPLIKQEKNKKG
ncbi:sortase [Sphingobacterium alkalisoli]|uniref:Sortase n=1 Tax=Sphingobacterium alkalisoli TaxID=1874115 RepID=A0A4U0H7F6_9SPHI|nr:DUF6358 family protein [Sphingobacterium alkalisoli]TJY67765.1 sortase [Sphingobacterium alkalisoli]GGH11523.1 hypothetical protein GCM10011418_10420 [Sphingobacterium alkalisoli]